MRALRRLILLAIAALAVSACGDGQLNFESNEAGDEHAEEHADAHAAHGEVHYWKDAQEVEQMLTEGEAIVQPEAAFESVELMITADVLEVEVRASRDGEFITGWETLEAKTHSERFHNAVLSLNEPADTLHLRGEPTLDFVRFEFFEHADDAFLDDAPFEGEHDEQTGEFGETHASAIARPGRYRPPADVHAKGAAQRGNFRYIGAPPYNGGRNCSGTFLPGSRRLGEHLVSKFRGAAYFQGYNCRRIRGSSGMSMHGTGRAIDVFIPKDRGMADNDLGDPVANYLIENATALGVQFFIWDRSKWNISYGTDRYYGGAHPHHDHLHIELTPHAAHHLNSFPAVSGGGQYALNLDIRFRGAKNTFGTGSSAAIADLYPGETQTADIIVTNKSNKDLPNLILGFWAQNPYVGVRNYQIFDDHPHHDRRTWKLNSADSDSRNPPKHAMGDSGKLYMHKFSPGETKRVRLEIVAKRYSFGLLDHPDLRVWVQHIDGLYGEQTGYFKTPTNGNAFGRNLRDYAQVDVLSHDHWRFEGVHAGDVEGWATSGHVDQFKLNTRSDVQALAAHASGHDAFIVAPEGIKIDANRWDELVLESRSHDGAHTKAIYWARAGERFSEERVMRFRSPGDSGWHRQVVRLGDHPRWSGQVVKLRVDVLDGEAPKAGDSGWYDTRKIYFQSSNEGRTNMPGEPYRR